MKLNKIVFPLALALAAILATTGCKHGFNGRVTNLPGHKPEAIAENQTPSTLPSGPAIETQPMPSAVPTTVAPGGGELPNWRPEDMNQDPDKLAAETVHFKFDSAVVQDSEQSKVAGVAQTLTSDPKGLLLIEGHCDERGTEEYNRALGERRALALRESLVKAGIDAARIQTRSFGKDQPVDPGHDEAAWAKNRRGQFIWCTPK